MQLFKWFSAVCAVAFCVSFSTVRADDNPAPAAAPEQPSQPTVTSAATPETNAPAETVAPTSAPVTSPGAVVVQPGESTTNVTKTVSTKTKADQRKAAAELKAKKKAEQKAVEQAQAKAKADKAAAKAKMKADQRKAAAELKAKKQAEQKAAKAPQTAKTPNVVKEAELQPIVAPPLPISADKQAQLQALLAKYMANAITPGQYQTERAKILADP